MIIFGGIEDGIYFSKKLYTFDLETKIFTHIRARISPSERHNHSQELVRDRLYIFGGIFESSILNDFWYWDLLKKEFN